MTSARQHPAESVATSANDLIGELQAVRNSVEELYILLGHIWRNRNELHDILARLQEENAERHEEIIACARCDVDSPPSLAAALQEGGINLCKDDGAGWNYLGVCPACQAEEGAADEPEPSPKGRQKDLFA